MHILSKDKVVCLGLGTLKEDFSNADQKLFLNHKISPKKVAYSNRQQLRAIQD